MGILTGKRALIVGVATDRSDRLGHRPGLP